MSGTSINDSLLSRKNNFDLIRFIAAVLVIYSHSFPLSMGNEDLEPLLNITNGQATFGGLAVRIFFVVSGFLITMSMLNSKGIVYYIKSRILRIIPALIPVILITVFIVGSIFTSLETLDYFTNVDTYKYLLSLSLFYNPQSLPGVFTDNIYPNIINGSLWTLPIEFFFYIVVGVLGLLKLLNKWTALLMFLVTIIMNMLNFPIGESYVYNFMYFNAGMILYLFKNEIKLNYWMALISLLLLCVTSQIGYFNYCFSIFGSYLIIFLSLGTKVKFNNFSKYGDFSYGIYIYAFPVQQVIVTISNNTISPLENFLLSFPTTLILAFISWHLIEKKALTLKNYTFRTTRLNKVVLRKA